MLPKYKNMQVCLYGLIYTFASTVSLSLSLFLACYTYYTTTSTYRYTIKSTKVYTTCEIRFWIRHQKITEQV